MDVIGRSYVLITLGVKGCNGNFMVEALTSSLSPPKPYQDQQ